MYLSLCESKPITPKFYNLGGGRGIRILVFAFCIIHTKTLVNVLMISQNIRFKAIYVRSKTFICIYWLAIPIYTYIRLERIFLVLYIIR